MSSNLLKEIRNVDKICTTGHDKNLKELFPKQKFADIKIGSNLNTLSHKGHKIVIVNYLPQYVVMEDSTTVTGKPERSFNDMKKCKEYLDSKRRIVTLDEVNE